MNLLIIGDYPVATQARMRAAFPTEWQLTIAAPAACALHLADAEVVIPEHVLVDDAFLAQTPRLRFVQVGAGYDNVDLAACSRRGVQVCNAAGLNADAVAEHVMALLLCHYKNICSLNQFMRTGGSAPLPDYHGGELSGRTLGLVGLGHIGRAVAVRAQAFGLRVLGWSYRPIEIPGGESVSLSQLFAESDIVSLHVPLKANTRHLIDDAALAQMKPGALLINTARGGLIDEAALVRALQRGTITAPVSMCSPKNHSLLKVRCASSTTSSSHRTPPAIPTARNSTQNASLISPRISSAGSPATSRREN